MSLAVKPQTRVRAKISSVGCYVPPGLLTNADLEAMVETNNQWIVERTGIHQRHIAEKGVPTSQLATEAARDCLRKRGIGAEELEKGWLGAILVATVTPGPSVPEPEPQVSHQDPAPPEPAVPSPS